jgi:hypothetical protein
VFTIAAFLALLADHAAHADALARLQPDKLEATHQAVLAFQPYWQKLDRPAPYTE